MLVSRAGGVQAHPWPAAVRSRLRHRLAPRWSGLGDGAAALTFDDGPGPHTGAVLDVLARHEVPATFFLVGRNAQRRPDLVERLVAEGHAVASHSYSHPDPGTLSARAWYREVRDGRRAVEDVAGRPVPLFRPPHGRTGRLGSLAARATGVRTWLWTHDPADWEPDLSPAQVLDRLRPLGAGDVAVLHDGLEQPVAPGALDRSAMVAALDRFLGAAHAAGLGFTTLDAVARPVVGPRREVPA